MDEVLTPDSSRYWPVEGYEAALAAGANPQLRQAVCARLAGAGQSERQAWDKPPRATPAPGSDRKTAAKYREALERLTA